MEGSMSGSETRSVGQGVSNTMKCVCVCVFLSPFYSTLCVAALGSWNGAESREQESGRAEVLDLDGTCEERSSLLTLPKSLTF